MISFYFVFFGLILSALLGAVIVTTLKYTNKSSFIKFALAFSGGFLLAILFEHLLPELYASGNASIGIYILSGFLIQLILEYFSGGIEHGHVHVHKGQALPWTLFLSLSIHSIIEGIPLGNHYAGIESGHDHSSNDSLFWGIVFHQIPVAIALMTLLLNTSLSKMKAWLVLILFALMTPIGLVIGLYITSGQLGLNYQMILGVVIGMFLHISTTIIFETSENHKFNFLKLISIIVGVSLALLLY
jgi:zinc transporter ZupT